jgi:undecaprenyl-diphosphatase
VPGDVVIATAGASVAVGLGIACAGSDVLPGEEPLFDAANGLPAIVGWPVRAVMQLGDAKLVPAIALLVYAGWRRWPLAGAAAAAGLSAWFIANRTKEAVDRPRPEALLDQVVSREDTHGRGYPSGHTAIAAALAVVIAPHVAVRWRWAVYAAPVVVGVGRMYVGAHLPLDAIGGLALGVAIGAAVRAGLGARVGPR